jgi:hypothetical protein
MGNNGYDRELALDARRRNLFDLIHCKSQNWWSAFRLVQH